MGNTSPHRREPNHQPIPTGRDLLLVLRTEKLRAVPIFREGQRVASLGITGSVSEIRPDNVEQVATYLKRMSSQIRR